MNVKLRLSDRYPGWRVLGGSFICAALAIGFTIYIFGLFVVPVSEEFGISRANANMGMIAIQAGVSLMSPIVGYFMDRHSARKMVVLGGVLFGSALMLASTTSNLVFMLFLIGVPLTFGMAACGVLGANTVVVRWFHVRRGRALGILALSTSVGGILSQPATAFLISSYGWRTALFSIGFFSAICFIAMALLLVRNRPTGREKGYAAEFLSVENSTESAPGNKTLSLKNERIWTHKDLLKNRNFWLLAIGIGLLQASDHALLISQVPYFLDTGLDIQMAALLVSVKALSAMGGKIVVGFLADKIDLRWLFAYVAGSNILLLAVYMAQPSFMVLLCAVALLGVAVGGVFPLWTNLMAWLYGPRSFGSVMGFVTIVNSPLTIASLRFVGEVHDRTGSYVPAFAVYIGVVIVSVVLILMLRPER